MHEDVADAADEMAPVEPEQVRAQLARILGAASFVAAPLLGEFLRFVVESALAGDGRDKEYTIAVEVLGRGASFDPKNDNSVRVHARRLRQRLDAYYDGPGNADPVVIEVPKGHYRAVFRLRRKDEDATRAGTSRLRRALSIGAAILLSGAVALWFSNRLPQNDTEASILVLPFQNLSESPDTDYFASGVHEDLLTRLAQFQGLKVISRATAQSLAEQKKSVVDMAAAAGVTRVLEGSIRRTADRVRLAVQLIAVPDEHHVWADTYDRDLVDVFAVEDEVAQTIADELRIRLDAKVVAGFAKARTTSIAAYDLVSRARDLKTRNPDGIKIRIANLKRAIELDPNYAEAYAALANEGFWCWAPESLRSEVMQNVEKALSLDPDNSEALVAMANVLAGRGQTERGREYLDRALAAAPGNAIAHIFYAGYSSNYQDRWRHLEEAYRLDPVGRAYFLVPMLLLPQGRDTEALQAAKDLVALAPDTPEPYEALANVYFARGDDVAGLRQLRHGIELSSCVADAVGFARALAERGQTAAAQRWLESIQHAPVLDALMLLRAENAVGLEAFLSHWLAQAPGSPEALTFYAYLQALRADEAYDRNDAETRQARLNDALAAFRTAAVGDDALLDRIRWLTVAEQAGDDALAAQLRSPMREILRVRFAPEEARLERAMLAALDGDRDRALDEFEQAIVPGQWCLPVLEVHGVLEDRGGAFHGVSADPRFQKLIAAERKRRAELNDRIAEEAPDLLEPPHLGAAT